jgi:uncharacterized protein YeaO (DUF488 family)
MFQIKRTYEGRARGDGWRVLVERLWPRGLSRERLSADAWMKEVAPSAALRRWFGHRIERWPEFKRRYKAELDSNTAAWRVLAATGRRRTVTLLYSAHDTLHNSAVVLRDYLSTRSHRARPTLGERPTGVQRS